jgi:hypothetical protein
MLRNSPDTSISLHGSPFPSEGNLVCGGVHIPGKFPPYTMASYYSLAGHSWF